MKKMRFIMPHLCRYRLNWARRASNNWSDQQEVFSTGGQVNSRPGQQEVRSTRVQVNKRSGQQEVRSTRGQDSRRSGRQEVRPTRGQVNPRDLSVGYGDPILASSG